MSSSSFGRIGRILGILACLVAFVGFLAWVGNAQDHANDPATLAVAVSDSDWSRGSASAPITLVEYSDFQCPACAAYYPVVKQLHEAYGDQLRIVYRNFPLTQIHPNAQLAAQAAEAAGNQGKFFEMHDALFEGQRTWSGLADPTDTFVGYAYALGLDLEQFQADLTGTAVKQAIADDLASGTRSNVDSTPTFYLNGTEITANIQGFDLFKAVIDAELEKTSPPTDATIPQGSETGDGTLNQ